MAGIVCLLILNTRNLAKHFKQSLSQQAQEYKWLLQVFYADAM